MPMAGVRASPRRRLNSCYPGEPPRARWETVMKYRLVVQTTDDLGSVSEQELLPEVVSEPGWQCAHAIWPAWIRGEETTECGWCRTPLLACEFITCPWCEWFVTTERVLEHWGGGCED